MEIQPMLAYYIYNGKLYSTKNKDVLNNISLQSIYEVIRIIDGVPLYFKEHMLRLRKSGELMGYSINKSDNEILSDISKLIKANDCKNLNINITFSNLNNTIQTFVMYFMKSYYPEKRFYEDGIHTVLLKSRRENPNVKIINSYVRQRANEELDRTNAMEVLLINEEGYITEGSRSNIFFIKGRQVYTAPSKKVLLGVTRNKIIEICKELNYELEEKHVHINELKDFDGAFITGTSVNILPITTINHMKYDSVHNIIIKDISNRYLKDVRKYIEENKNML